MLNLTRWIVTAILLACPLHNVCGQSLSPWKASPSAAQGADKSSLSLDELESMLSQTKQAIKLALERDAKVESDSVQISELDLLKLKEIVIAQRIGIAEEKEGIESEIRQQQALLSALQSTGPIEQPPYSLILVDELRHQIQLEKLRVESSENQISAGQSLLESTQRTYQESEQRRRQLKEEIRESSGDPQELEELEHSLARFRLQSDVLEHAIALRTAELSNSELKLEMGQLQQQFLEEKRELIAKNAVFLQEHLETQLKSLRQLEEDYKKQLAEVTQRSNYYQRKWYEAKESLEASDVPFDIQTLITQSWKLGLDAKREEMTLINQRLAEIVLMRHHWNVRFQVFNNLEDAPSLEKLRDEASETQTRYLKLERVLENRLEDKRLTIAQLQEDLAAEIHQDDVTRQWIEFQVNELRDVSEVYGRHLNRIKSFRRLVDNVIDEIEVDLEPVVEHPRLSEFVDTFVTFWNYEITAVDDRPITVKKVISGIILLIFGLFMSRLLSRQIGRRLLPRFGVNEGAQGALQSISFYLFFASFFFLALEIVNIPVTVFTFFGGAVAIGVGFGSQNILSNFISGLILLAERPIRVGDLVDLDGIYGTIHQIGARSTRVRTGANLEIIVPNAKFLENNVTNWTLSDTRIRVTVSVGVAYGSPTALVRDLLRQTVEQHPKVLTTPEPITLFREFGDNSLNFEIHFWLDMRTIMEGERVKSEIRFDIDDVFRQHNISIAFPQRDIHIDTTKPLEINLRNMPDETSMLPSQRRAA